MNVQAIIFTKYGATLLIVSSFRFTFFGCSRKHIFFKQSHFCTSPGLYPEAEWTKTTTKTKTCLRVYLLKQGGQTVKLTNAPIRRQRFRISPHIFFSIYFCSCHHFATFQIAFWVKPELKKSTSSFLM